MNPAQTLTPMESWQWVNLVNAPPQRGQKEYSLMPRDSIWIMGVTSPPKIDEKEDVVWQQFARLAHKK